MEPEEVTVSLPELETVCLFCEGTGRGHVCRCRDCNGAGYVPTEAGRKILALMQHNFRPMLDDARDDHDT